ncbi:hypothetical protein ACA097_17680 [Pseudomonas sp. QL9]|uniref:hypothetical protein n=1 Tax=Pseudomonas sp. QL9 TaxID=3242725 RepID=UPI00352BC58E
MGDSMLARRKVFFSPLLDFFLIGGGALVAYFIVLACQLDRASFDIVWLAWILAFFVNGPHFLISYEILYLGHRHRLISDPKFFWAGVLAPSLLIACVGYALWEGNVSLFKAALYTMFFTVGWHYIKQAYGCFVVYSAGQGVFFSALEQKIIKYALFPLWWSSFLRLFTVDAVGEYWGLKYSLPPVLIQWAGCVYWLSLIGVLPLAWVFLRRWKNGKEWPGLTAVTPLVVVYIWLSPLLRHDLFFYIIPLFHSLQYLLFSGAYTRGKVRRAGSGYRGYIMWWGMAFALAALLFYLVPTRLDALKILPGGLPYNSFLIVFIVFINIHHYIIDSVIWQGGNKEVRDNLQMRPLKPSEGLGQLKMD